MTSFERDVLGIAALADPIRRRLYLHVCAQPGPVSRDQAAEAVGVARHRAKFHLDRLEAEGLLEVDYARPSGRSGPGAGRPAKRYRRANTEIAVSLPQRRYELAGRLMADAIAESTRTGTAITKVLDRVASAHGRSLADAIYDLDAVPRTAYAAVELAMWLLSRLGYEPRLQGARVSLANCPFHALAHTHTELVCQMNHALIAGLVDALAPGQLRAQLEPVEGHCCVTVVAPEGAAVTGTR